MSSPPRTIRSTFDIGSDAPSFLLPNPNGQDWLTVWNSGSGGLAIASSAQIVGALRARSFYVRDDDPVQVQFVWGQRLTSFATQPGQKVRTIPYAISDVPLAGVDEADLYSTPALLVSGSTPTSSTSLITPNAGEVYTHIDLAFVNAQSSGPEQEALSASYGKGSNAVLLYPPTGNSRQVVRVDGPVSLTVLCGSTTARCDWNVFGVANVVR